MKDHYYVTINCIALCSSKFYEAIEREHVYYRDLVKCDVVADTGRVLELRVPEMYGTKGITAYARPYNNEEEEFSLDSCCYERCVASVCADNIPTVRVEVNWISPNHSNIVTYASW